MKIKVLRYPAYGVATLLLGSFMGVAGADNTDGASQSSHHNSKHAVGIVKEVRIGTSRYRDVAVAEAEGWVSTQNCVSGMDEGAMGVHYVNFSLLGDGALDAQRPEILIYEKKNGKMRLVGVEFLTIYEAWHAVNGDATPVLEGQLFHFSGAPNRYGLPPNYTLHVWSWKNNPHGMFVNWNPRVSCEEYTGG